MKLKTRIKATTVTAVSKSSTHVKRLYGRIYSAFEAVTWLVLGFIFGICLHHALSGSAVASEIKREIKPLETTSTADIKIVGGIFTAKGDRTLTMQCLEVSPVDSNYCISARHVVLKKKARKNQFTVESISSERVAPDNIKEALTSIHDLDPQDFTDNGLTRYLEMDLIYLSTWLILVGHQVESKAVIGTAYGSYLLSATLQVIKAPFKALNRLIQKRTRSHRGEKANQVIDDMAKLKLYTLESAPKIKISRVAFDNIIQSIKASDEILKINYGPLVFKDIEANPSYTTVNPIVLGGDTSSNRHRSNALYKVEMLSAFETAGKVYSSPAVTIDGSVGIGSHSGDFYIFNPDGTLRSQYKTGKWIHASTKTLKNGDFTVGSYDGTMYVFKPSGELAWTSTPGGKIYSQTVELPDGGVVFGDDQGFVYDIEPKTGLVRKKFKTEGMVHATPVLFKKGALAGMLGVVSVDHNLYVIDPKKMELKWSYEAGKGVVHSEPTELSDGTIVFGSYDGFVHFVNPDGTLKTKFKTGDWVHAVPLILKDGTVVIGSMDHHLYFLNPDGTLKAKFQTDGKVISSATQTDDGVIVFGSYDHHVYFVSEKAELLAKFKTGGKIWSSPAVLNDGQTITVGAGDRKVYFLKLIKTQI